MPSKWEGVPINMVPADERECERTRREDEAEKKRAESVEKGETVPKDGNVVHNLANSADSIVERSSTIDAITNMNASSPISRGIHDGMMKRPKHVDENVVFAPAGMVGVREERPMPIIQSKQDEHLRKELDVARKQIELDEQDKDFLRETIEKQKKRIETLEKEPKLTEEMAADLFALKKRRESDAKRVANWEKRHPRLK